MPFLGGSMQVHSGQHAVNIDWEWQNFDGLLSNPVVFALRLKKYKKHYRTCQYCQF
jgi:hypothetical protein